MARKMIEVHTGVRTKKIYYKEDPNAPVMSSGAKVELAPKPELPELITRKCIECGTEYEVPCGPGGQRIYCSHRCRERRKARVKSRRRRLRAAGEVVNYDEENPAILKMRAEAHVKAARGYLAEKTALALSKAQEVKTLEHLEMDVKAVRALIASVVAENLVVVSEVLAGKKKWTPAQANLFRTLMDRVIPVAPKETPPKKLKDLAEKLSSESEKRLVDMSVEELEEMMRMQMAIPVKSNKGIEP